MREEIKLRTFICFKSCSHLPDDCAFTVHWDDDPAGPRTVAPRENLFIPCVAHEVGGNSAAEPQTTPSLFDLLDFKIHCFIMRAAVEPKPLCSNFDENFHLLACVLFAAFENCCETDSNTAVDILKSFESNGYSHTALTPFRRQDMIDILKNIFVGEFTDEMESERVLKVLQWIRSADFEHCPRSVSVGLNAWIKMLSNVKKLAKTLKNCGELLVIRFNISYDEEVAESYQNMLKASLSDMNIVCKNSKKMSGSTSIVLSFLIDSISRQQFNQLVDEVEVQYPTVCGVGLANEADILIEFTDEYSIQFDRWVNLHSELAPVIVKDSLSMTPLPLAVFCQSLTRRGRCCRNKTKDRSMRCWRHREEG